MLDRLFLSILVLCNHWIGLSFLESTSVPVRLLQLLAEYPVSPGELISKPFSSDPLASELLAFAAEQPLMPKHLLTIAHRQRSQPSLLPWLWLGAGASVGVGVAAYGLKSANPEPTRGRSMIASPMGRPSATLTAQCTKVHQTHISKPQASVLSTQYIVEELLIKLQSDDRAIRGHAIWNLGQLGAPLAVQPLVNSMGTVDSQQRSLILAALSEIGIRTLHPLKQALMMALQDKNADVRKNAIRDITRIYVAMDHIHQILTQAIADEDPEVRATAQWALDKAYLPPIPDHPTLPTAVVRHS